MMSYTENITQFIQYGCTVIKNFISPEEVQNLLKECNVIVDKMDPSKHQTVFKTGHEQVANDYFLNSGDKISFFFEEKAFNENGELIVDKGKSLNKIGHALHWLNPVFKNITFSQNVKKVLKQLSYKDPVLVQSMYIFKHPEIGGEVVPHQDSSYLHTRPLSTVGFWFPLVDVTEENGCLFYIPASHRHQIHQQFVRKEGDSGAELTGKFPDYPESDYKPITANKGDCVLIHGSVIHKSGKNFSSQSRPVYTFHVVEQENTEYSAQNWLQPTTTLPFPSVYNVNDY